MRKGWPLGAINLNAYVIDVVGIVDGNYVRRDANGAAIVFVQVQEAAVVSPGAPSRPDTGQGRAREGGEGVMIEIVDYHSEGGEDEKRSVNRGEGGVLAPEDGSFCSDVHACEL